MLLRGLIHFWCTPSIVQGIHVYFARLYGAQLWSLLSKYACLLNSHLKRIFVRYFYNVPTFFHPYAVLLLPTPITYTGLHWNPVDGSRLHSTWRNWRDRTLPLRRGGGVTQGLGGFRTLINLIVYIFWIFENFIDFIYKIKLKLVNIIELEFLLPEW